MSSSGSGYGQMATICQHGNSQSGPTHCLKFTE